MSDNYGRDIGESSVVAGGRIVQLGTKPGVLDAHVRRGYLLLRSEAYYEGPYLVTREAPLDFYFNDEDTWKLWKIVEFAVGRKPTPAPEPEEEEG